eukprot:6173701-Pleurochrysis_carterae.AAC.4
MEFSAFGTVLNSSTVTIQPLGLKLRRPSIRKPTIVPLAAESAINGQQKSESHSQPMDPVNTAR